MDHDGTVECRSRCREAWPVARDWQSGGRVRRDVDKELDSLDDTRLVDSARSGSRRAFEVLYERYVDGIYRYHYRSCGGRVGDAEDLTQQTFLYALESLSTYSGRGSVRSWLFVIARNAFVDWTTRRMTVELVEEMAVDDGDTPERIVVDRQLQDELLTCIRVFLDALSDERKRRVFELVAFEGLDQKAVASIVGMEHDACRQLYSRLRKELTRFLGPLSRARRGRA